MSEISIFQLVSEAEETDLKLALSETPKTGFLATRPNYNVCAVSNNNSRPCVHIYKNKW